MAAHSKLGASSASRWLSCAGSVGLIDAMKETDAVVNTVVKLRNNEKIDVGEKIFIVAKFIESSIDSSEANVAGVARSILTAICDKAFTSSVYADEGTAAHALAETCLNSGLDPSDFIYSEVEGFQVTEEMAEAVKVYVDLVRSRIEQSEEERKEFPRIDSPVFGFELRFNLKHIHPEMFGTSDFTCAMLKSRRLYVDDYKHGAGVPVDIDGNQQLMFYALGALTVIDPDWVDEVIISIIQPRAKHVEGAIRSAAYSVKWLRNEFADKLKRGALATEADDATLVAGSHCKWCAARSLCPAKNTYVARQIGDYKKLPAPQDLTAEQMSNILKHRKEIETWLDSIQQTAATLAVAGGTIPDFKLVRSQKHRTFHDKEAAKASLTAMFGDAVLQTDLLGLTALEKVIKSKVGSKEAVDKVISPLVYKPEGDIVLAPVHDKREAIVLGPMFEAIE